MAIGKKASIPNPALEPFGKLVGEWATTGSHSYLPGVVLQGRASIGWLEGGAFLIIRSEIDHPRFPQGVEIFGSDDAEKALYMLHFDERGTSRKYDVAATADGFAWRRDDPVFSQRMTLAIEPGGNAMRSKGEMSRDGGAWEGDLELAYVRLAD